MRISDWSSDVCSSDLCTGVGLRRQAVGERRPVGKAGAERLLVVKVLMKLGHHEQSLRGDQARLANVLREITDRKSVGEGKSVLVRVDLGGRRINKKKT